MIFINFSNHPKSSWDPNQTAACVDPSNPAMVCKVIDLKFPHISAAASDQEVDDLAATYLNKIINLCHEHYPESIQLTYNNFPYRIPVHIMGEMTFSFALIRLLQQKGFICLASTTRRINKRTEDGKGWIREFEFVRFREYSKL